MIWKTPVLEVACFPGADRRDASDHDDLVVRRELHHLARGHERACGLLTGDHKVAEQRRETMSSVVLHRAHLSRGPEHIGHALGDALSKNSVIQDWLGPHATQRAIERAQAARTEHFSSFTVERRTARVTTCTLEH